VKIEIPKILLELRAEATKAKAQAGEGRLEKLGYGLFAAVMKNPRVYEFVTRMAAKLFPGDRSSGWVSSLPRIFKPKPIAGWLSQRELPAPAPKQFRQLWRERQAARKEDR
jgi:L-lactate utilization protein LutB